MANTKLALLICILAAGCSGGAALAPPTGEIAPPTTPATPAPQAAPSVLGAGYSFGECAGRVCRGELALEGVDLSFYGTSWTDPTPVSAITARATPALVEALRDAAAALDGQALAPVYGCPDCADGGASFVDLRGPSGTMRHSYEHGAPPAVLAPLDALLAEIFDAVEGCAGSARVQILHCNDGE